MSDLRKSVENQRGIALVVALLVLVFLSLLASSLMMSLNVETKIAGRTMRESRALNNAEAGVSEALERIRNGDVPNNMNAKMVTQIYLAQAGSLPVVGTDSLALPTEQPSGNWLTYSEAKKGPNILTVTYKTNTARTIVYRYDKTKNPAVNIATGSPIYVITSTGRFGDAQRTVVTEVTQTPIKTYLKAAVTAKKQIHLKKDTYYCGYNHRIDTPTWQAIAKGRDGSVESCNDDLSKQRWELGGGNLVGAWSEGKVKETSKCFGTPSTYLANQVGFFAGAWDVFGMTQAEFYQFVGPATQTKKIQNQNMNGVYYFDPDGKKGKNNGKIELKNISGEGFIYVEGEVRIKGDFDFRGLIYATNKIQVDGKLWVLGGVIAGKDLHVHSHEDEAAVLYSEDAIANNIGKYAGPFVTLSWRERF